MKYIIEVPDETGQAYYNIAPYIREDSAMWMDGYKKGLDTGRDEAWNFARKLLNYKNKDWEDLMNLLLVNNCSYQGAKDMYEEWEREKNEIQIGDEVKIKDLEDKGIVTSVLATRCDVLWLDGTVSEDVLMSELCKTGRHFDEVEELLKKMRGSDD